MKSGYTIKYQAKIHFIKATVVDCIDVLARKSYKDYIIDCLNFCINNKSIILYGYVVMSNYLHLIVQANNDELSNLLKDFIKFIIKTISEKIKNDAEREWMLERFKKATESRTRNKNYQF